MIDADTKRTYDAAIARAAADREAATRRAETAETDAMMVRRTLEAVIRFCTERGYDRNMPDELVEMVNVTMEWVAEEVTE